MQVTTKREYILEVTARELSLIGRALSGILKDNEYQEATELNIKLTEAVARETAESYNLAKQAHERASELKRRFNA